MLLRRPMHVFVRVRFLHRRIKLTGYFHALKVSSCTYLNREISLYSDQILALLSPAPQTGQWTSLLPRMRAIRRTLHTPIGSHFVSIEASRCVETPAEARMSHFSGSSVARQLGYFPVVAHQIDWLLIAISCLAECSKFRLL